MSKLVNILSALVLLLGTQARAEEPIKAYHYDAWVNKDVRAGEMGLRLTCDIDPEKVSETKRKNLPLVEITLKTKDGKSINFNSSEARIARKGSIIDVPPMIGEYSKTIRTDYNLDIELPKWVPSGDYKVSSAVLLIGKSTCVANDMNEDVKYKSKDEKKKSYDARAFRTMSDDDKSECTFKYDSETSKHEVPVRVTFNSDDGIPRYKFAKVFYKRANGEETYSFFRTGTDNTSVKSFSQSRGEKDLVVSYLNLDVPVPVEKNARVEVSKVELEDVFGRKTVVSAEPGQRTTCHYMPTPEMMGQMANSNETQASPTQKKTISDYARQFFSGNKNESDSAKP